MIGDDGGDLQQDVLLDAVEFRPDRRFRKGVDEEVDGRGSEGVEVDHEGLRGVDLRVIDEQIALKENPNLTALFKVEKMQLLEVLDQTDDARELETHLSKETLNLPREYKAIIRNLQKR